LKDSLFGLHCPSEKENNGLWCPTHQSFGTSNYYTNTLPILKDSPLFLGDNCSKNKGCFVTITYGMVGVGFDKTAMIGGHL